MKKVMITVKSRQDSPDGDNNSMELTAVGNYKIENGTSYITYDESRTLGENRVFTLIKASGNSTVTMERSGDLNSTIVVEKGKKNNCIYSTDVGHFVLGVFGESIYNDLGESGGDLSFGYTLDIESNYVSRNQVEISVREV